MNTTKAVIFDIYNTLFHNGPDAWVVTFQGICQEQALPADPEGLYLRWRALEAETRRGRVNLEAPELSPPFRPYQEVWQECFARLFRELELDADAAAAACRVVTDMGRRQPYPDSLPVVTQLHTWYRTAVLSNADKSFLYPILESAALPLDAVLSSEAVGAYKPHPLPFQRMLEVLQVAPPEAVFVGDTLYDDILGAQRVGMRTVLVNWDGAPVDTSVAAPDEQVTNLRELLTILEP